MPESWGRSGLRIVFALCAAGAVAWSVFALRDESTVGPFDDVADRIALGNQFKPEALRRVLPYVDEAEQRAGCNRVFHDAAIIRVQARRMALDENDRVAADRHLSRAIADLETELACSPTRADSWFLLFAMRSARDGKIAPSLPFLGMSYQMAANQGSLAPLRVRAALPLLPAFGPNMRTYVENDYASIAREQPETAAEIFAESGEARRTDLVKLIQATPRAAKARFVQRLDAANVPVPAELRSSSP